MTPAPDKAPPEKAPPEKALPGTADRIAAIVLLLFAVFVIVEARALPYWTGSAPGPGFLPLWLGALLVVASVVLLARPAAPHTMPDRPTIVRLTVIVGMTAGAAALTLAIGLVLASAVFMGAALVYLRPGHTRANLAATVLTPLVIWLLFVRWLAVPLPAGPLGF